MPVLAKNVSRLGLVSAMALFASSRRSAGAGAIGQYHLLSSPRPASAMAPTSAASLAPTSIARRSPGRGRGRQDLARLSLDAGRRRQAGGQCARPHRQGTVAELKGRRDRQGCRRSAQRPNNLTKQTALSEKGDVINGRGDTPNRHDALTGSQPDGTAFAAGEDRTCKNWTSSHAGRGDGRPYRPHRPARRRCVKILELFASLARPGWRLFAGRSQEHRRRRVAVLFRGELIGGFLPLLAGGGGCRCDRPGILRTIGICSKNSGLIVEQRRQA